eukprot:620339-Rhodomonas_salina.1
MDCTRSCIGRWGKLSLNTACTSIQTETCSQGRSPWRRRCGRSSRRNRRGRAPAKVSASI